MSGLTKDVLLKPCINLVLYFGRDEWDGSVDIHEMLGINEDFNEITKFIPNYKINLLDVSRLGSEKHLNTDLQWIFGMLSYRNSKVQLRAYVNEHKDYFRNIDEDSFRAANILLDAGDKLKIPDTVKGEKLDMCKALDENADIGIMTICIRMVLQRAKLNL